LKARQKKGKIAKLLGMSERTIRREIKMGSVIQRDSELRDRLVYRADYAQRVHEERASNKGRGFKIGHDHALCRHLEQKIGVEKYSPDAAIGEIRRGKYRFAETLCTKTVYNMIDRGFFLNLTNADLPVKRAGKKRVYRPVRRALNHRGGKSITERPKEVDSRRRTGHWEMDLVVGSTKECLLVMSERASRLELIRRLPGKEQAYVAAALDGIEREGKYRFLTITTDNGSEFLDSAGIEQSCLGKKKRTTHYFAHPYSSWERGTNENTNKLIRRFLPKDTDILAYSDENIARIER
jgi:IS30 family transposase